MKYDILYNWISPVTGRILCDPDYVLVGDANGIALPSPVIIDIQLDIIDIRHDIDNLNKTSFIVGFPNSVLPNAQVLNNLSDGFIYNTKGIVSTQDIPILSLPQGNIWIGDQNNVPQPQPIVEITNLPNLTTGKIWVGDENNRPIESDNLPNPSEATYILQSPDANLPNAQALNSLSDGIMFDKGGIIETKEVLSIDNLPALGLTNFPIPTPPFFVGQIWEGTESGRPEVSNSLGVITADIELINVRFLSAHFILNSGLPYLRKAMPAAQYLEDLAPGGILKTDPLGVISIAKNAVTGPENPTEGIIPQFILNADEGNCVLGYTTLQVVDSDTEYGNNVSGINNLGCQFVVARQDISAIGDIVAEKSMGTPNVRIYQTNAVGPGADNYVGFSGPANTVLQSMWVLPNAEGTAGQSMVTDGNMNLSWGSGGLPELAQSKIWIGDAENVAQPQPTIQLSNLPNLSEGKTWVGDAENRPTESTSNVPPSDATYLLTNANDDLPNAQVISEINAGMVKTDGAGKLQHAIPDEDYATVETLEKIKEEAQAAADQAKTSAEEASASAEEATSAAAEATASAAEASASAVAAGVEAGLAAASAVGAGVSAAAAAGSAVEASGAATEATIAAAIATGAGAGSTAAAAAAAYSAYLASGYADDAKDSADDAEESAKDAAASAIDSENWANNSLNYSQNSLLYSNLGQLYLSQTQYYFISTQDYYSRFLTFSLNDFPVTGDLNLQNFKIITLGNPFNPQDAANKEYVDIAVGNISQTALVLTGDITGTGLLENPISTTLSATGVIEGEYTNPILTISSQGRITQATNGTPSENMVTLVGDITGTGQTGTNIVTTLGYEIERNHPISSATLFAYTGNDPTCPFGIGLIVPFLSEATSAVLDFSHAVDNDHPNSSYYFNYTYNPDLSSNFGLFYSDVSQTIPLFSLSDKDLTRINFNNLLIGNVQDPVLPQDVANKEYVDAHPGSGGTVTSIGLNTNTTGIIIKNTPVTTSGIIEIDLSLNLPKTIGDQGQVLTSDGIGGTNWTNSNGGTVTSISTYTSSAGLILSGSPITTEGTLIFDLNDELEVIATFNNTGILARTANATYSFLTLEGTQGQINISNDTGILGNPLFSLASTKVKAGTYTFSTFTVDDFGRITDASSGIIPEGGVIEVDTGVGLSGGPITSKGTVYITDTGVIQGEYINPTITINSQGQIIEASSGTTPVNDATYIIQTPDEELPNAQILGNLTTGILKNTMNSGVLTIAEAGVDYYCDGHIGDLSLNVIPITEDLDLQNYKITNLADPINPQDAATKAYVDSLLPSGDDIILKKDVIGKGKTGPNGEIIIEGDFVGEGVTGIPVNTTFTKTLNEIPNAGNVDMAGYSLENLVEFPQNELDAVSFKFLWKLLNDEII